MTAVGDARALVHRSVGRPGSPFEAHSDRVFELSRLLAPGGDEECLEVAALLHDIGLLEKRGAAAYVSDGGRVARELLAPYDWPAERVQLCVDCIERHHEQRSQAFRGAEVEAMRKADLIDVVPPVRFGLTREQVRSVNARHPRKGFYRAIGGLVLPELLRHPRYVLRAFRPGS